MEPQDPLTTFQSLFINILPFYFNVRNYVSKFILHSPRGREWTKGMLLSIVQEWLEQATNVIQNNSFDQTFHINKIQYMIVVALLFVTHNTRYLNFRQNSNKNWANRFTLYDFEQKRKPINLPLYEIWVYGHFNYWKITRVLLPTSLALKENTVKIIMNHETLNVGEFHSYCFNFCYTKIPFPFLHTQTHKHIPFRLSIQNCL